MVKEVEGRRVIHLVKEGSRDKDLQSPSSSKSPNINAEQGENAAMRLVAKITGPQADAITKNLIDNEAMFEFKDESKDGQPIVAIYVEQDGPLGKLEDMEVE